MQMDSETNRDLPVLRGTNVLLRLATEGDVGSILDFYRQNEKFLAPTSPLSPKGFLTEEYWRDRVTQAFEEFQADQSVRFFIFAKDEEDRVIGSANLTNIIRGVFHACYLGYAIGEKDQGKGLMFESLRLVTNYA